MMSAGYHCTLGMLGMGMGMLKCFLLPQKWYSTSRSTPAVLKYWEYSQTCLRSGTNHIIFSFSGGVHWTQRNLEANKPPSYPWSPQCWSALLELFEYSNSKDQIAYSTYLVFSIQSKFTIWPNTGFHSALE